MPSKLNVFLHRRPADKFSIRAGSNDQLSGGVLHNIKQIIVNKKYMDDFNDLALLELETPLVFTTSIKAIHLETETIPVGSEVMVSGWGQLSTANENLPALLQFHTLKTIADSLCEFQILVNPESYLCLGHTKGNGVCSGDSGGPATFEGKLAGVANFVMDECGSYNADAYAKVSHHIDWIKKNMVSA